jgi:hypothetical protein
MLETNLSPLKNPVLAGKGIRPLSEAALEQIGTR